MTFAWFRRRSERIKEEIVKEVKPVWLSVEDRLTQIARSQSELSEQAVEIKIITSSIVKALGLPDETAEVLKELTPVLREIPPLLKVLPPALKSIDGQFVVISEGQDQLRKEIDHLQMLISNVSQQIAAAHR
jgi:archaellum component FlaC